MVSAGEALAEALGVARRGLPVFLGTQGVPVVLGAALGVAYDLAVSPAFLELDAAVKAQDTERAAALLAPALGGALAVAVVGLALTMAGTTLGVFVADATARGERLAVGQAWSRAAPRMGAVAVAGFAVGGALLGILLAVLALTTLSPFLSLLVFAAIPLMAYVFATWMLAFPVAALEGKGPGASLSRSAFLTAGSRGVLVLACLGALGILLVPAVAILAATGGFSQAAPSTGTLAARVLATLPFNLLASFVFSSLAVHLHARLTAERRDAEPYVPPAAP
ncbi:MAG TPA: hypothetical protein VHH36_01650 [Candidatus Thermoplasmatota archaeon]|nr:hypothetical protein [Candidatus Thermoplasmatota archaeon]